MNCLVPSKGLEWVNLVVGGSLACSAFFFTREPAIWNSAIVGVLVVCFSITALSRYADWAEWSNLALGAWALIAPLLLGFGTAKEPMWTHLGAGLCIATVAAIQLKASRNAKSAPSGRSG